MTAAIVDPHDRVLAIRRLGERWTLPGGDCDARHSLGFRLRHHVRRATGFEIKAPTVVGICDLGDNLAILARCEISGVGSDITADTRAMRWMDRDAIRSDMEEGYVQGLLDALDAVELGRVTADSDMRDDLAPELLAS